MNLQDFWKMLTGDRSRARKVRQKRKRAERSRMFFEPLEVRTLCAADLRSFDGSGNNLAHPEWGSTEEAFLRKAAAEYADGISAAAGQDRPSARLVSNLVAAQEDQDAGNDRNLSAMVYAWGQFLDHDIDLTNSGAANESLPIAVPAGDPSFDPNGTGTQTIGLTRSAYDPSTGTSTSNPRQQLNSITAFIDGSQVYGSDAERAAALRTFSGGRLKTSEGDLLPYNTMDLPNATFGGPASSWFVAGDIRANENPELIAMQTLWVREHNRQADLLAKADPRMTDEQIYQQARRIVIGELQAITYNEFLPAILGPDALRPYQGYKPQVNPGVSNEFATAAYRFGHSMLGPNIEFLDDQGNAVRDSVGLRDAFFNGSLIEQEGIDEVLKYLASDNANEIDTQVIDDIRNFLFGPPGSGGLDLASLNIQRGRDHGLADYNAVRQAYGLRPVRTFADITSDPAQQQALQEAYGDVNNIDLWVGGLAEDHAAGASVGPLFQRIMADQFQRLRDGDRFYYERDLKGRQLDAVRRTTLADVIRANTDTENLQQNVFVFNAGISGRVVADANADGRLQSQERGLADIVVQLQDAQGNIVATAKTNRQGEYRFDNLDLGAYRVRIVTPSGLRQTTADPQEIQLTRGGVVGRNDFGLASTAAPRPRTGNGPAAASTLDELTGVQGMLDPLGLASNAPRRR